MTYILCCHLKIWKKIMNCSFSQEFSSYLWIQDPFVGGCDLHDIPTNMKENLTVLPSDETLRLLLSGQDTNFWPSIHKEILCWLMKHLHILIYVKDFLLWLPLKINIRIFWMSLHAWEWNEYSTRYWSWNKQTSLPLILNVCGLTFFYLCTNKHVIWMDKSLYYFHCKSRGGIDVD
jgi:hypothetical protein